MEGKDRYQSDREAFVTAEMGLPFKASQPKRGMVFAKMDSIIRRNAEKAQQAKAYNQPQSIHCELPKQETASEPFLESVFIE